MEEKHSRRVLREQLFSEGKILIFFFHSVYIVFSIHLIFITDLFAVRYLCGMCNEDKCRVAADILVASLGIFLCLVSVRTYCVPITTLKQNKRSRLSSGEGKPDLVIDQDQQYKTTLKIEGKTDRTTKG